MADSVVVNNELADHTHSSIVHGHTCCKDVPESFVIAIEWQTFSIESPWYEGALAAVHSPAQIFLIYELSFNFTAVSFIIRAYWMKELHWQLKMPIKRHHSLLIERYLNL